MKVFENEHGNKTGKGLGRAPEGRKAETTEAGREGCPSLARVFLWLYKEGPGLVFSPLALGKWPVEGTVVVTTF